MNKMNNNGMVKVVSIALGAVVIAVLGFMFMRDKVGTGAFAPRQLNGGDLVITNDSQDTFSTAFMRSGKMMSQVVHPGEKATGGKGLIRLFVAKKNGNYEIQYPYPRPDGKPTQVSLTQVLKAVHEIQVGQELNTQKGMIDDIRVDYEEVRDLDATY